MKMVQIATETAAASPAGLRRLPDSAAVDSHMSSRSSETLKNMNDGGHQVHFQHTVSDSKSYRVEAAMEARLR